MPKPHVSVRLSTDEIDRVDALTKILIKGTPLMNGYRSYGLRAALLRGLEAYEAEAAAKKPPAKSNRARLVGRTKRARASAPG